jgi:DnaK suppressor protein
VSRGQNSEAASKRYVSGLGLCVLANWHGWVTLKTATMMTTLEDISKLQEILEQQEADLVHAVRKNGDIAIEKSADQMDEIQRATERELAIRKLDRESDLLRNVRAALRRIQDGSFGICVQCESTISPRRLAAVPWAPLCIQCRELADQDERDRGSPSQALVEAA